MDKVWIIVGIDSMDYKRKIVEIKGVYTSKEKAEEALNTIEHIESDIFECGEEEMEILEMPTNSVSLDYRNTLSYNIEKYQNFIDTMRRLLNDEDSKPHGVKDQNRWL